MSNITLTDGLFIGSEEGAGEAVIGNWAAISDRSGEIVPAYGFTQAEREVASATGSETPKIAASRYELQGIRTFVRVDLREPRN